MVTAADNSLALIVRLCAAEAVLRRERPLPPERLSPKVSSIARDADAVRSQAERVS
jgi:hypothetical protein